MSKLSIAIDGPSGVGKGITTKLVAEKLNLKPLDSGAIYRAIAYYMLINDITLENFDSNELGKIHIGFSEHNFVQLNEQAIEDKIRNDEIGKLASDFGKLKSVRKFSTQIQKKLVLSGGFVVDGRATAYEIPEIPIKIFLDADLKERAHRRYLEYKKEDSSIKESEVYEHLKQRDTQDKTRTEHPLSKHPDAILINNNNLTISEQVQLILDVYSEFNQNSQETQ
jgi:cytidylate kinase